MLFSLRYRIKIEGLEKVTQAKKKGILFLPNHPAEIDPVILWLILAPYFRPRPLVVEEFFFQKGMRRVMDFIGAIPIVTTISMNKWKELQIEKTKMKIIGQLSQGENCMIYPAGRLKRSPEEQIRAAGLVYDLIKLKPDCPVVLIRTTGLWGSTFSRAPTKVSPDFGKVLLNGIKALLKNGIFFMPRREVRVEMEFAPADFPRGAEKMEFNRYLESWYNQRGPEPEKYISFLFWKQQLPEIITSEQESLEPISISEEKKQEILAHLSKMARRPIADLHPYLHLSNDLGLDSLDIAQLIVFLEDRYEIGQIPLGELNRVADLFRAAERKIEASAISEKKKRWPDEKSRPGIEIPSGETIQEVFLKSCKRMKKAIACADATAGPLSYRKLKQSAFVLSLKIREMPGDKIGILLPSSVGAYLTFMATLLAGKTPVMLNWTAGFRNLEYAAEACNLKTILSSFRFLSRADTVDLGQTDDILVLLEEVRRSISLKDKLRGLFLSLLPIAKGNGENTAVILFTSGTETLPKGVPLTHRNVLSNHRGVIASLKFYPSDISYGVLPPFHSMGLCLTGLLPLLIGVKCCYAPDPTNSRALINDIMHYRPTLFACAPSFVSSMLQLAKEEELKSLRMVMTGADKAPQNLYDTFKRRGQTFVEGYGISECSPLITVTREDTPPVGVGKPIPEVKVAIVDPENGQLLEQGQEGEVCIAGPGVFSGYLGIKRDPFLIFEGEKWFRSGDRGRLERDGSLILSGRLKRFVKIGGEMVSLGGLEKDLLGICQKNGWLPVLEEPQLAVAVKEGDKAKIILYITADVDRDKINRELKEFGHGSIVKIAEVRKVDEIPLTGTGKVQYRRLDETI
ncbi:MAG: AMP-binding protein [Verrucomicrobia bacterium]|nr:AMP-binding protein [Verrucomicrobiota bacterium]